MPTGMPASQHNSMSGVNSTIANVTSSTIRVWGIVDGTVCFVESTDSGNTFNPTIVKLGKRTLAEGVSAAQGLHAAAGHRAVWREPQGNTGEYRIILYYGGN